MKINVVFVRMKNSEIMYDPLILQDGNCAFVINRGCAYDVAYRNPKHCSIELNVSYDPALRAILC